MVETTVVKGSDFSTTTGIVLGVSVGSSVTSCGTGRLDGSTLPLTGVSVGTSMIIRLVIRGTGLVIFLGAGLTGVFIGTTFFGLTTGLFLVGRVVRMAFFTTAKDCLANSKEQPAVIDTAKIIRMIALFFFIFLIKV